MKISVFGIGYVGAVASACMAKTGHEVIAVDPFKIKVDFINEGKSPIVENGLDDLIREGVEKGMLRATQDYRDAVLNSEMSLICVGTPSEEDGSLDYKYIYGICKEIGAAIKEKDAYHIIVVRSTVVPGTLMNIVKPALEEASGKKQVSISVSATTLSSCARARPSMIISIPRRLSWAPWMTRQPKKS